MVSANGWEEVRWEASVYGAPDGRFNYFASKSLGILVRAASKELRRRNIQLADCGNTHANNWIFRGVSLYSIQRVQIRADEGNSVPAI
jgi:hypothetical protein